MLTCGGFFFWWSQELVCASDTQTQKQDGYGHRQRVRKGGGEGRRVVREGGREGSPQQEDSGNKNQHCARVQASTGDVSAMKFNSEKSLGGSCEFGCG